MAATSARPISCGSNAIEADAILLGEPAGVHEDWEAIRVISRGFSGFRVIVKGTQTHSSISDQLPTVNAVEAMANVLVALRRELRLRYPEHPLVPSRTDDQPRREGASVASATACSPVTPSSGATSARRRG